MDAKLLMTSLRTWRRALGLLVSAAALPLVMMACGGGGDADTTSTPQGTLRLALTDAPSCGFDQVHVTIQKIRVHQSSSAGDGDAGWSELLLSPARRVDLLTLTNGVLSELGQTALPTGKYTQLRLQLAANDAASPMANSVVPTGGQETALATPSAFQTGLKMNVDFDVAADKVADFVLDFDACRSVVKLGNSGNFNLKPVVKVMARVADAANRIIGHVPPQLAASTLVSAQLNGVPVKSTQPDSTGKFVLSPLSAGVYDVVIVASGRAIATVTGVPVTTSTNTQLNASSSPINPPVSTPRLASGVVTVAPATSAIDALVLVRKSYAGGPVVEVAAAQADGVSGGFSFMLPSTAALKAAYAAGSTSIVFSADGGLPAGAYTVQASAGATSRSLDIDVSNVDATGLGFAFP